MEYSPPIPPPSPYCLKSSNSPLFLLNPALSSFCVHSTHSTHSTNSTNTTHTTHTTHSTHSTHFTPTMTNSSLWVEHSSVDLVHCPAHHFTIYWISLHLVGSQKSMLKKKRTFSPEWEKMNSYQTNKKCNINEEKVQIVISSTYFDNQNNMFCYNQQHI